MRHFTKVLALTTAAAVFLAPISVDIVGFDLGIAAVSAAGNGKGNGGGNKGGNGGSPQHGQSAAHSDATKSNGNNGDAAGVPAKKGKSQKVASATGDDKTLNLHAKLGGLNSLKRNINGLMNSSDPRMDEIRTFVEASAGLAAAQGALPQAEADLAGAQGAYDTLVAGFGLVAFDADPAAYPDTSLATLQARLDVLDAIVLSDPANTAAAAEAAALATAIATIVPSSQLLALQTAEADLQTINDAILAGEAATTDEMLIEALMVAANDNRVAQYGDGYVDPDLLDWAKQRLGVGDYSGLIDDYIAKL